jgi:single-strand DNA-binding protein
MASFNRVILIGYVGKTPELSATKSGKAVVKFPLATSEKWNKKDGEKGERTDWHNIVFYGKQAGIAAKYLDKGSLCCVEGRVHYASWDGEDNQRHYKTYIDGSNIQLMPGTGKNFVEKDAVPEELVSSGADVTIMDSVDALPESSGEVYDYSENYPF